MTVLDATASPLEPADRASFGVLLLLAAGLLLLTRRAGRGRRRRALKPCLPARLKSNFDF